MRSSDGDQKARLLAVAELLSRQSHDVHVCDETRLIRASFGKQLACRRLQQLLRLASIADAFHMPPEVGPVTTSNLPIDAVERATKVPGDSCSITVSDTRSLIIQDARTDGVFAGLTAGCLEASHLTPLLLSIRPRSVLAIIAVGWVSVETRLHSPESVCDK